MVLPLAAPEAARVAEPVIRARAVEGVGVPVVRVRVSFRVRICFRVRVRVCAVEGVGIRSFNWHLMDFPLVLRILRRPRVLDAGVGGAVLESDVRTGRSRRSSSRAVGAERVLPVGEGIVVVETLTTQYLVL